jgi:hypothetical protein
MWFLSMGERHGFWLVAVSVLTFPKSCQHCALFLCTLQWNEVKRYLGKLGDSLLLSGRFCLLPFLPLSFQAQKPMAQFFYTGTDGNKQGPLSVEQIQALIDRGSITPNTPLETDSGHTGLAGQIPGLNFDTAPLPLSQRSPILRAGNTAIKEAGVAAKAVGEGWTVARQWTIFAWLLDFAFRDLRLPEVSRWVCRIVYAITWVVAVLTILYVTFRAITLPVISSDEYGYTVYGIPDRIVDLFKVWIGCPLFVVAVRIACEWQIILLDWVAETRKAARKYTDG